MFHFCQTQSPPRTQCQRRRRRRRGRKKWNMINFFSLLLCIFPWCIESHLSLTYYLLIFTNLEVGRQINFGIKKVDKLMFTKFWQCIQSDGCCRPLFGGQHFLLRHSVRGAGGSQQVFESGGYRRRSRRPSESELESQKAVEFLPRPSSCQLRRPNQQGGGRMGQISKVWIIWESNPYSGDCNYVQRQKGPFMNTLGPP